jgi:sterol desaturase/sphingolipid hydroxylase (fatty acid hydroxylase superfamily)
MSELRPRQDPTVLAIPVFFATMAGEHLLSRRRISTAALPAGDATLAEERFLSRRRISTAAPPAGDYERRDTVASLSMGALSFAAPLIAARVLGPITPGRGRYGRHLVAAAVGAVAATTAADIVNRRLRRNRRDRTRLGRAVARVSSVGGVASVVLGGVAVSSAWQSKTSISRLWERRYVGQWSRQGLALMAAIAGWDFIYYWNHRFMHESRYMWAQHVVHHSSEHYNLSTALRQPVLEALGTPIPYGAMCLIGVTPKQVELARGINLLYQYWIHTEAIDRLGPAESALNTPSHHRAHHGSNQAYLDRNHGSILIVWDRLFGTFEPEKEMPVYGLTKNIDSFNLGTIATHEFASILRDVAASTTWRDRIGYVVRGPGWAGRRRAESGTP